MTLGEGERSEASTMPLCISTTVNKSAYCVCEGLQTRMYESTRRRAPRIHAHAIKEYVLHGGGKRFHVRFLLAVGCWLLAVGCWLLAVGCWLLAVGCWLLAGVYTMCRYMRMLHADKLHVNIQDTHTHIWAYTYCIHLQHVTYHIHTLHIHT